jgi:glycosyltransferase involved in cell wall biosynthesis
VRVGIIAYLLHGGSNYRAAGVSQYLQHLLKYLPVTCPEHTYFALHGSDAPKLDGVRSIQTNAPTRWQPVRILWEQVAAPVEVWGHHLDVVHGAVNIVPLAAAQPSVVTVHDLSFLRMPDRFPAAKVAYLRKAVACSVMRATRVIAVSEHTKADLAHYFGRREEEVTVVYSGVDPFFRPLSTDALNAIPSSRLGGRPYILHVGTLEPRKNIDVLIRAFAVCREELNLPHLLALVGAKGWKFESLFSLVLQLGLEDHVYFADYASSKELPLWYNGADLFAYPSAYEGFGLPVLEAMACGVPTVTSSTSALKELASGACLTVDPGSQEALQLALARLLTDSELRASLRTAGLARAAQFTWERCARQTVAIYVQAREAGRR